jgi:single stranded DNA-binding protein
VTFIDCTLWARQAEIGQQYLKKGSSVFLEGHLQLDTWEDKQTGQKRSRLRVVGENMQLLDAKREGSEATSSGPPRPAVHTPHARQAVPVSAKAPSFVEPELDVDAPF